MKSRRGGTILILLGVMVAVFVAIIVFSVTRNASTETKIQTTDVVVATKPISERTVVAADALGIRQMPVDAVPAGVVPTLADAVGKMTTTAIYPGEIILMAKLADTQGQSGMSYSLEKGQVLITFPASDIISTGAVRVGDSVDIMVTMKPTGQGGNATPGQATNNPPATTQLTTTTPLTTNNLPATTQLTMQNLKVVSIGTQSAASKNGAQAAPTGGSLITFALGQQDALMLKALKDGEGLTLELVLRAAGDDQIVTTEPVTMQTIIDRYKLR